MPKSQRLFIKVHNGFPEHWKTAGLSDKAFRHLIEAWCFCSRNLNDGELTNAQVSKLFSQKTRRELVAVGFIDETSTGVKMHDYLDHQQSALEVSDLRERRAEAGSKGGKAKASRVASAREVAKQTPSKRVADTDIDIDRDELASASSGALAPRNGSPTAQTLVAEWIDHCAEKPPGRVIGHVAKELKSLLDEGFDPERVRAALVEWNRKGLHPSTLPSVLHGITNGSAMPKGQQATNDLFDRAMRRAIERESA